MNISLLKDSSLPETFGWLFIPVDETPCAEPPGLASMPGVVGSEGEYPSLTRFSIYLLRV